jgi:serine/threonine protein kinase
MNEGAEVLPRTREPAEGPASERPDQMQQRARARLGTILNDKWQLDAVLGIGGMAAVYAATHRNGSRAAVKILHAELSLDPFVRQRFLWEGRVANAVGHDGVVRVLDDDTAQDGSLFLVTELLEGETLEQRRQRTPRSTRGSAHRPPPSRHAHRRARPPDRAPRPQAGERVSHA